MTQAQAKFRHHETGTPRPSYIVNSIRPLPTTPKWTLLGLLCVKALYEAIEARAVAQRTAEMQIKPKRLN